MLLTTEDRNKLKDAYKQILNKTYTINESADAVVYDDYDRQMFDYVRNEDIVKSYDNPNKFIILMDMNNPNHKQKFDNICEHFGFTYTLGDYDDEEDGFPLIPDEQFRNALNNYFNRVDGLESGEMSVLKNKLNNMLSCMELIEEESSNIKLEIDEVIGNNMDYDDKTPIRDLLFTIEAKMTYLYKNLRTFENDIESLKQYRYI